MRRNYLSASLHAHDAEIEVSWVTDSSEKVGGFVSVRIHDVSILIFDEEQADRLVTAAIAAKMMLIRHRVDHENDTKEAHDC